MSLGSIALTAFICFCGLYEYTRVPFGLKGAPSHFQRVMASFVLAGILYKICEVYIDDIIVFAQTAKELLSRIRQVFDRIRKHKLLLHPRKAHIGLKRIEYTGHVLDREGLSFSPEKLRTVLDFPLPTTKGALKKFTGLANYFRDHIQGHSSVVAPLQRYLENYSKTCALHAIALDAEAVHAFETIKEMIQNCPKLFFLWGWRIHNPISH